jgi:5-methylcytosine-specific restriction endonuclease McrA
MSNGSANGSTRKWRALRERKLRLNPVCEMCGQAPAIEVDHIKQLVHGGPRFAWRNLRALCSPCHHLRHGARESASSPDAATGMPTGRHWWNAPT